MIRNKALEFALLQIYEIAEAIFKETSAELNASLVLCFRWVEGALALPVGARALLLREVLKKVSY